MTHEERLSAAVILTQMYGEDALAKVVENRRNHYQWNDGFDLAYDALSENKKLWREAMEELAGGPDVGEFGSTT